jgi:hypothetical protein
MSEGEEQMEINSKFGIKISELVELVETYRGREFDDDLKSIKADHGGVEGLAEKLHTDCHNGIIPTDLEERDAVFGSNKKEPPTRTSF